MQKSANFFCPHPFRSQKFSGSSFALKIMSQPHGQTYRPEFKFYRKICVCLFVCLFFFFSRTPPLGDSKLVRTPFFTLGFLTSVCERSMGTKKVSSHSTNTVE